MLFTGTIVVFSDEYDDKTAALDVAEVGFELEIDDEDDVGVVDGGEDGKVFTRDTSPVNRHKHVSRQTHKISIIQVI